MTAVFLLVGLPGSGKTTKARALAHENRALRFTPDEWVIPLFGAGDGMAGGKRDVLEGRMVSLALELVRINTNVVLDFGCWARDERSALRALCTDQGARFQLVYLPIDRGRQVQRITHRRTTNPGATYVMTEADLDRWRVQFQPPTDDEIGGAHLDKPPEPFPSWLAWAQERWPSLTLPDDSL